MMEIRAFSSADASDVVALWEACALTRPWNDPATDIALKVAHSADLFLVAVFDGKVVGSVMAGYDGHRGWINYLAVDPEAQRGGIGRALMNEAERRLAALDCPKINLQVRVSNQQALGFYAALGYANDDVVSLGKRLDGRA
jgi:ribosomal protein S18 acetylase RimI-like enzyme